MTAAGGGGPQVKGGKVRALGMSTLERSPSAPDVPTIAATLPGFEAAAWHGIFVPAATARGIVDKLGAEMKRFLDLPEVKARFFARRGALADDAGGICRVHR
jgi:tripartite-type tricarboxylate transporter receptor subunit TctC